jgi:nucleoid DNA-binding protein
VADRTQKLIDALAAGLAAMLANGETVTIQGFASFTAEDGVVRASLDRGLKSTIVDNRMVPEQFRCAPLAERVAKDQARKLAEVEAALSAWVHRMAEGLRMGVRATIAGVGTFTVTHEMKRLPNSGVQMWGRPCFAFKPEGPPARRP